MLLTVAIPAKLLVLVRESNYNVSVVVLRVGMRFIKFYYFSTHYFIGVENEVNCS